MPGTTDLPTEDAKLVTLARSARARAGAEEGAAVRDDIGRTYAAATVSLASLRLTALQAAVAAAVSSGSAVLDAVCVVSPSGQLGGDDRAVVDELSIGTVVLAAPDGTLHTGRPAQG
jgi:hypothetical protein